VIDALRGFQKRVSRFSSFQRKSSPLFCACFPYSVPSARCFQYRGNQVTFPKSCRPVILNNSPFFACDDAPVAVFASRDFHCIFPPPRLADSALPDAIPFSPPGEDHVPSPLSKLQVSRYFFFPLPHWTSATSEGGLTALGIPTSSSPPATLLKKSFPLPMYRDR